MTPDVNLPKHLIVMKLPVERDIPYFFKISGFSPVVIIHLSNLGQRAANSYLSQRKSFFLNLYVRSWQGENVQPQ
jgi:hypothetical protein